MHKELHHAVYNNHIMRSKWSYPFTKEFSLRLIAQYNGLLANSLETVKNINFDMLNLDPGPCFRIAGTTECDPLAMPPKPRISKNETTACCTHCTIAILPAF